MPVIIQDSLILTKVTKMGTDFISLKCGLTVFCDKHMAGICLTKDLEEMPEEEFASMPKTAFGLTADPIAEIIKGLLLDEIITERDLQESLISSDKLPN
jgi:hypothetical protein